MILSRLFMLGLGGAMLLGCGDDEVPLHVDFEYQTNCEPAGGCSTRDHDLVGNRGDTDPNDPGLVLGLECEIVNAGDTVVATNLRAQDRDLTVTLPENGMHIRNGTVAVDSRMGCADGDVQLYDGNEFTGGCQGLAPGQCDITVEEYSSSEGRLTLTIDCVDLEGPGESVRSVKDGVLVMTGCTITEDSR